MPAFTVTAVDTTANTLTATGVAAVGGAPGTVLTTGDRLRLRNVGGALPAATPSLAGATDYYAVRVSDDAIKISDTNAHALAGTNIVDITGGLGAGTTKIEFELPYAIPTEVAVDGVSQVHAKDLNSVWISLVALYDLLTGQSQSIFTGVQLAGALTVGGNESVGGNLTVTGSVTQGAIQTIPLEIYNVGESSHSSADSTFAGNVGVLKQIVVPVGKTIVALRATMRDSATGPTAPVLGLYSNDPASGSTLLSNIASSSASNGSGNRQTLPLTGLSTVVQTGKTYWASLIAGSGTANCHLYQWEVDVTG